MRGTVKFYDSKKKWGFITDTEGNDVFLHQSSIQMDGCRHLNKEDIVEFELGAGNNGREQAINVTPILTLAMIVRELDKEGLCLSRITENKGKHGWYLTDKEEKEPITNKEMSFLELAAYVGFDVEGLE